MVHFWDNMFGAGWQWGGGLAVTDALQKEDPGFDSQSDQRHFWVCVCVQALPVSAWILSRYSGFPRRYKNKLSCLDQMETVNKMPRVWVLGLLRLKITLKVKESTIRVKLLYFMLSSDPLSSNPAITPQNLQTKYEF